MTGIFLVKNDTGSPIDLINWGIRINPAETVELSNYDKAVLDPEVGGYITAGDLIRVVEGEEQSPANSKIFWAENMHADGMESKYGYTYSQRPDATYKNPIIYLGAPENIVYVSDSRGTDGLNDEGTYAYPFKTIQHAVSILRGTSRSEMAIILDTGEDYSAAPKLQIGWSGANGSGKKVFIFAYDGLHQVTKMGDIKVSYACDLSLINVSVGIVEADMQFGQFAESICTDGCYIRDNTSSLDSLLSIFSMKNTYVETGKTLPSSWQGDYYDYAVATKLLGTHYHNSVLDMEGKKITSIDDGTASDDVMAFGQKTTELEGTVILSTGETGTTKYLREDGDGTCSWQTPPSGGGMKADVTLTGASPVYADLTGAGWVNGDRGNGIGTGGKIFFMSRYSDSLKYVEMG